MSTNNERIRILTLVQNGQMELQEATKLLYEMESNNPTLEPNYAAGEQKSNRVLRILKKDMHTGKINMDLSIPVNLLEAGRRIGARYSPELVGLTKDEIRELALSPVGYILTDYYDEDEGQYTRISVE
ncbi:MAG TPA: hypothetical protein PKK90_06655 [Anaerolineaceae bacterium]|jgi:hypothetical protein|nr:hypothetical protein [Anaerolineaceae bacterium]HPT23545.1 hypothetical protein [Anaerolineaceae bacterium]